MKNPSSASSGAGGDARIEAAISAYPDITPEQLAELIHWFDKEASAFDVATIASQPRLQEGYLRFRADHYDRFTVKDWLKLAAVLVALAVLILVAVTKGG